MKTHYVALTVQVSINVNIFERRSKREPSKINDRNEMNENY